MIKSGHKGDPWEQPFLPGRGAAEQGFSLLEFMVSSLILMIVAAAVFTLLAQTQRAGSYQTEVQGVIENTRYAMEAVERVLQQSGNNLSGTASSGIDITSASELRARTDITGSGSAWTPSEPDKGDPDGDTSDAGEDLRIRYNAAARTLDLGSNAAPQPIAYNISAFSMQYFDRGGVITNVGAAVCRVRISLTGTSSYPDPQTGKVFSIQLNSDVQLLTCR
jgi:type II secretory pathway pseudopilin PulG